MLSKPSPDSNTLGDMFQIGSLLTQFRKEHGGSKMAQLIRSFALQAQGPKFILQNPHEKQDLVAHGCNFSA